MYTSLETNCQVFFILPNILLLWVKLELDGTFNEMGLMKAKNVLQFFVFQYALRSESTSFAGLKEVLLWLKPTTDWKVGLEYWALTTFSTPWDNQRIGLPLRLMGIERRNHMFQRDMHLQPRSLSMSNLILPFMQFIDVYSSRYFEVMWGNTVDSQFCNLFSLRYFNTMKRNWISGDQIEEDTFSLFLYPLSRYRMYLDPFNFLMLEATKLACMRKMCQINGT